MGVIDDYYGGYENLAMYGGDMEAAYDSQVGSRSLFSRTCRDNLHTAAVQ
jgi:hypothetical protein